MTTQNQEQISRVVDMENFPGPYINLKLDNGSMVQISELDFQSMIPKFYVSMAFEAIKDVRAALSVREDGTIRLSRIIQSSGFLENGTIKFENLEEGDESLNSLKCEFPKLHEAIHYLHFRPSLKLQIEVMNDFKDFLLSISNINKHAILVSVGEKVTVQNYSRECCDYILGHSDKVNVPDFSSNKDLELYKLNKELIEATTNLRASILQITHH